MKVKYLSKLAFDSIILHGKKFLGSIFLYMLTVLIISFLIIISKMNMNHKADLEKSLAGGCKNTGYIVKYSISDDNLTTKIMELNSIKTAGTWQSMGVSGTNHTLSLLREIQGKHIENIKYYEDGMLEVMWMPKTSWGLFNLSLSEGYEPEYYKDDDMEILYLGSAYSGKVKTGTIIETTYDKFIIGGILDDKSYMAQSHLNILNKYSISANYSLEFGIIEVSPVIPKLDVVFFSVEDGYTYDEAAREIEEYAKANDISVTVSSIDALIKSIEYSLSPIKKYTVEILILVGITLCIVMTCNQTSEIVTRRSEYGIYIANGFTYADISKIIVIENILKSVIAIIFSIPLIILFINKFFGRGYNDKIVLYSILAKDVFIKIIIIACVIVIFSSIVPLFTFNKYKPVELIGGNDT